MDGNIIKQFHITPGLWKLNFKYLFCSLQINVSNCTADAFHPSCILAVISEFHADHTLQRNLLNFNLKNLILSKIEFIIWELNHF